MTVKTTLSSTDRHHHFLPEKVGQGTFATQGAAVAAALEQMMRDEEEREVALSAVGQEIHARTETLRAGSSTRTTHSPLPVVPLARRVIYSIRFYPLLTHEFDAITHWIIYSTMPEAAERDLSEIGAAIAKLETTPMGLMSNCFPCRSVGEWIGTGRCQRGELSLSYGSG